MKVLSSYSNLSKKLLVWITNVCKRGNKSKKNFYYRYIRQRSTLTTPTRVIFLSLIAKSLIGRLGNPK
jgi:hypothetical protein